jgi:hypothetical protein
MTPFEKVLGTLKQASVLVEKVKHGWAVPPGRPKYVYVGSVLGVTREAALELKELLADERIRVCLSSRTMSIECVLTGMEMLVLERMRIE